MPFDDFNDINMNNTEKRKRQWQYNDPLIRK